MSRGLLRKSDLKTELGLTDRQVRRLLEDEKLPKVKLTGRTGEVLIRREDLDAYIAACTVPARRGPLAGR